MSFQKLSLPIGAVLGVLGFLWNPFAEYVRSRGAAEARLASIESMQQGDHARLTQLEGTVLNFVRDQNGWISDLRADMAAERATTNLILRELDKKR